MNKVPGWYSWVKGNEIPIPQNHIRYCDHVLYDQVSTSQRFYKYNFEVFIRKCTKYYRENKIPKHVGNSILICYWRYYYNRQLIFQMTKKPIMNHYVVRKKDRYPTYMLQRNPGHELQLDIWEYHDPYTNKRVKYLIITEIYTRYVWMQRVVKATNQLGITARTTFNAFRQAMFMGQKDNSIGYQFHEYLHNRVQIIRMDNGVEFLDVFPERTKDLFPNAEINYVAAKKFTFGRVGETGPVEATIRMIRKVILDYTSVIHRSILTEDQIINVLGTYNNLPQIYTLRNYTPEQIAQDLMGNHELVFKINERRDQMFEQRKKIVLDMKQKWYQDVTPLNDDAVEEIGYRLYLDPGLFPKETSIRVSLPVYRITRSNLNTVDLQEILPTYDHRHIPLQKLNIPWKSLVAVKLPVLDGPELIGLKIRQHLAMRKDWDTFGAPSEEEKNIHLIDDNHQEQNQQEQLQQIVIPPRVHPRRNQPPVDYRQFFGRQRSPQG